MKNFPVSVKDNIPVSITKDQNTGNSKTDLAQSDAEQELKLQGMYLFMEPLIPLLVETKKTLLRMSVFDKMVKENAKHGFKGRYPDLRIDYPNFILSKGTLPNPGDLSVSSQKAGKLVFRWTDDGGVFSSLPTDRLFVGVYNHKPGSWITSAYVAYRSAGRYTMYANNFRNKPVHIYAGFISEDSERVSTSVYLGEVKVL